MITDEPLAYYYLGHGGAEKAKTVATVPSDDGFVILMNKEDVKMQQDINGALKKVMETVYMTSCSINGSMYPSAVNNIIV